MLGANNADPSAEGNALSHTSCPAGNAPKSTFVNPMDSANGHIAHSVRMKGAAKNGMRIHFAMASVTAAVTAARTTIHSQSIGLG